MLDKAFVNRWLTDFGSKLGEIQQKLKLDDMEFN